MNDVDIFNDIDMSGMNLLDVLVLRDDAYVHLTKKAIALFGSRLSAAASRYLNNNNPLEWNGVEPITNLSGFARVMGVAVPEIGTVMSVGSEDIEVTAENQKKYKQIVRFILPVNLLKDGTEIELFDFIEELAKIAALTVEQELETILRDYLTYGLSKLSDHEKYAKIVKLPKETITSLDFEISDLSKQQREALNLFGGCNTGTKN